MAKKKKKPSPKQPGASEKFLEFLTKRQGIIYPLAIAIAGLVVYVNMFHVPLVYDDLRFINGKI